MDQALLSSIPNSCFSAQVTLLTDQEDNTVGSPVGSGQWRGRYVPAGSIRQDSAHSSLSVLCLDAGRHALFQQAVHIHANSSPDVLLPWKEFPSRQLTNAQGGGSIF